VVLVIVAAFYTAFRCMMDELAQEDMMEERDYMLQRVERARASGRQIDGLESAKRFMASIPVILPMKASTHTEELLLLL